MSESEKSGEKEGPLFTALTEAKLCFEKGLCSQAEYDKKREAILFGPPVSPSGGDEGVLAKHFEAKELRNLQPWRIDVQRFQTIKADWAKMTKQQKQALFLRKAENQRLGATEAMLGMYLLYGTEEDLDFLRSLLVSSSGDQRMFMHNMYVATNREEVFMLANGHKIAHLAAPLFPAFEQYHLLNDMVLAEEAVGGGGSEKKIFKDPEEGDPLGGGLSCPVILNPDGSAYADITDIGEAVLFLQRQVATTTQALQSLQAHQTQAKAKGAFWRKKNAPAYSPYNRQSYGPAPTHAQGYSPTYNAQGYPAQRVGNPGGGETPTTPPTTVKKI
jgi:hypothetical protein